MKNKVINEILSNGGICNVYLKLRFSFPVPYSEFKQMKFCNDAVQSRSTDHSPDLEYFQNLTEISLSRDTSLEKFA